MLHSLLLPFLLASGVSRSAAPPNSELVDCLPVGCQVVIDAPGLTNLLQGGLQQPWVHRIRSIPGVAHALQEAPMQPEAAIAVAGVFLGRPLLPALAELCAGGAALGLQLGEGQPKAYLVLEAEDADELEFLSEHILTQIERAQDLPSGVLLDAAIDRDGAQLWELGDELCFAIRGTRLFVGKDQDDVLAMLAPATRQAGVTSTPAWSQTAPGFRTDASMRLWVNVASLESLAGRNELGDLRSLGNNPTAHFLLGSELARIGSAQVAWFELLGGNEELHLEFRTHGTQYENAAELVPGDRPAPALPEARPGELLRGHLYRNLDALFTHRQDLFEVSVQPKFAEAAANLALFLGGADAEEELFPHLSPWFGFIAREVDMEPQPDLALPAVCILVQIEGSEALGDRLVSGFQTAIGLINVDAAQERKPSMLLKLHQHEGVAITSANYLSPPEGDGVDARFNLEPACAVVDNTFVLGTHVALVREVAAQLKTGQVTALPKPTDRLAIDGQALHRALTANVDGLVLNSVLEDGLTPEQARRDVENLLAIADLLKSFETTLSNPAETIVGLDITLELFPWKKQ